MLNQPYKNLLKTVNIIKMLSSWIGLDVLTEGFKYTPLTYFLFMWIIVYYSLMVYNIYVFQDDILIVLEVIVTNGVGLPVSKLMWHLEFSE